MIRQEADSPDGKVAFEMRGDIAVLRIENPPVNAGSHAVRSGIVCGIARAAQAGAAGVVLVGAGRCFMAGSDLREFGKPLAPPDLPETIAALEQAPFPVVAALHGVALGGGLELAMGCDYRLADRATKLGLPEVSLGIIPGAGGTQRLPRLIGCSRAIGMICGARRLSATEAVEIGLVDTLADGDPEEAALAFLEAAPRAKRRTIDTTPPEEPPETVSAAAESALQRGKGRPNVAEAIRLVRAAATAEAPTALADERAVFQALRLGDDAKALRYLFFAERRAASVAGLDMQTALDVHRAAVIGGGTMGQGIARALLAAGLRVTLVERDADALDAAIHAIGASLERSLRKGRIDETERAARVERLHGTTDLGGLADCDLAIEAVFEEMALKKDVLFRLETALAPGAIIASNTSYLDIDEMAAGLARPERVLGLHFFSPADVMPLLELVRARRTSDVALATGLKLARRLGKQPVVARVGEGFIGNRVFAAYRHRAELLVLDGAPPEQVDAAVTEFGFAMGPFAVADLAGLDIAWARRKRLQRAGDPRAGEAPIADRLCEAGRLGRKSGKGWYDHTGGTPRPDPETDAIIADARRAAGRTATPMDGRTIQRQLLAAIVNEAACLLEDGIAARASDVDVALTGGYGFPRWRGGPLYWAWRQDRDTLRADLETLAKSVGDGHRPGPVATTLHEIETLPES